MRNLTRVTKTIGLIGCAILVSSLPLFSQSAPSGPQPAPNDPDLRSTYVLGPGDQIVAHVVSVPDISDKPVRIDLNGEIRIPMAGRIHAAGMTTEQLEAELTKRLKFYLEEPDVALTIAEFRSQPVSIIGEVGSPGVHQLEGQKTLIEMLSLAGGPRPEAGPSVRITRLLSWGRVPVPGAADDPTGKFSIAEIDLKPLMEAKSPEKNIVIRPQDVISIPKAEIVFVMGEVGKVGPLTLNEGHSISILQAVSSAGGTLRTAATGNAKILRPTPGSSKWNELPVDIKKILNGKANDQQLLAGDILFVPGSASKRAGIRAIEAAMQAGTMMATYGVYH
jgi:polysaccharide export outer membrane protein